MWLILWAHKDVCGSVGLVPYQDQHSQKAIKVSRYNVASHPEALFGGNWLVTDVRGGFTFTPCLNPRVHLIMNIIIITLDLFC